jgi:hypothetical protein
MRGSLGATTATPDQPAQILRRLLRLNVPLGHTRSGALETMQDAGGQTTKTVD